MFDPYHKWLAIPKDQRPPTYYQLLGISPAENDVDVIREAALRQTSHVRTYQAGPYARECTNLLNEIALARSTLLDPGKRKEYHTRLEAAWWENPSPSQESAESPWLPPESSGASSPVGQVSVSGMCQLLVRSRLFNGDEVETLKKQWLRQTQTPDDAVLFSQWLIANQHVTEYQADLLARGHVDHFFLGPYKLLDRIGKGRLAGVYKAVHRLGQLVAIKILPPSRARDHGQLARFRREAILSRGLNHPNVIRTFDAGETSGLHYLVMEFLSGQTLQDVLERRGRLTVPETVMIGCQILLGMQHLHEIGLVHRNLEPSNLMVVFSSGSSQPENLLQATVKILDFSQGRALFDLGTLESDQSLGLAQEENILAAPAYLAPELARNANRVDIRGDIYSLGCILYQALAGKPPLTESNPTQGSRQALERTQSLREFNPEVPESLEQIVSRMTDSDPARRYSTPASVTQALAAVLTELVPAANNSPRMPAGTLPGPAQDPAMGANEASSWFDFQGSETERVSHPRRNRSHPNYLLIFLLGAGSVLIAELLAWLLVYWLQVTP